MDPVKEQAMRRIIPAIVLASVALWLIVEHGATPVGAQPSTKKKNVRFVNNTTDAGLKFILVDYYTDGNGGGILGTTEVNQGQGQTINAFVASGNRYCVVYE